LVIENGIDAVYMGGRILLIFYCFGKNTLIKKLKYVISKKSFGELR
jgi:hypothetical protein